MRFSSGILAIILLFSSGVVQAQEATCPQVKVSPMLHSETRHISYIYDQSAEELEAAHYGADGRGHAPILGLAGGRIGVSVDLRFSIEPAGGTLYCTNISQMKVDFYAVPEIRVASNFMRGSCEYDSVIEHERKHVQILTDAYDSALPEFRRKIWDVAEGVPQAQPGSMVQSQQFQAQVSALVTREINAYVDTLNVEIANQQASIDTPGEYQEIISRCKNWNKKLSAQP